MATRAFTFDRTYSWFEPDYTYNVRDNATGRCIGAVARITGERAWHASNKTWSGGGELARTFKTRRDATTTLRHIADGIDPEIFGGYCTREEES